MEKQDSSHSAPIEQEQDRHRNDKRDGEDGTTTEEIVNEQGEDSSNEPES